VCKVATSKVLEVAAQPKGGRAFVSRAEGDKDVHEEVAGGGCTDVATLKEEEAARELSRMQQITLPAALVWLLPTVVPLKISFSARRSEK
jgi:hypothetical protein